MKKATKQADKTPVVANPYSWPVGIQQSNSNDLSFLKALQEKARLLGRTYQHSGYQGL